MGEDYSTPTFGSYPMRMAKEMREMLGAGSILAADLETTEGGKEYPRFPTVVCEEKRLEKAFPGVEEPALNPIPKDPRVVPHNFSFACDNNHQRMFVRYQNQAMMDNGLKRGSIGHRFATSRSSTESLGILKETLQDEGTRW